MAWILRAPNGFKLKYSSPEYFTIKLNHDGNLVKEDMMEYYVSGTVNYFDFCDNDRISRTELRAMCKEVGYVEEESLSYRVCHLDGKWVFNIIKTDSDVTSMVQSLNNDLLELYLVNSHLEGSTSVEHNKYVDVEDGLLDIDITSWEWDCGSFSQDNYTCLDLSTHIPSTRQNPPPAKEPPPTNEPQPTSRQNQPTTTRRRRRRHLDHDSNSKSDFDFDVFIDTDYELSEDDDALFDANVDKEIEWTGVRQKRVVKSDILHDCLSKTESEERDSSDGFMSFDSASSDEDGKKKAKFRKYRPVLGKVQPIIEEKMIFKNRAQCVEAIRQHAIVNGKEITFEKNDTDRVRAHCATNCPWKILASSITTDRIALQVKTYNPNHDCGWMRTNKLLNSSWLANTYFKEFKIKPSWPLTEIVEQVMGDFNVKISSGMAFNARRKATKKMEGSYVEQYGKLWDYCGEMVRTNPGTSVYLHFKKDMDGITTDKFERMYICWAALKKGFIEGCRPIIGVDGCHLKGPHGGQLLAAVAIDGNNQIYPVAYAMVEVEDEASWSWFLEHLKNDLEIPNEPTFTIISDKQKGLINAISNLLPVWNTDIVLGIYTAI
ncbi:uncharacterized protein LOC131329341 [Rhododendron vialii]|uniref:uncharacterized protein LOC131329341 n=1 Tax=Rhododendron vialii TaxID=182163 RepID=UPI00265D78D7|nr:uncharacterized protein LOC131329341 [Rhododendron vialii]